MQGDSILVHDRSTYALRRLVPAGDTFTLEPYRPPSVDAVAFEFERHGVADPKALVAHFESDGAVLLSSEDGLNMCVSRDTLAQELYRTKFMGHTLVWSEGSTKFESRAIPLARDLVESSGVRAKKLDEPCLKPLDALPPTILLAAFEGATNWVGELIEAGVDVDQTDKHGQTPLFVASLANQSASVARLIAAGANVNSRDNDGSTPLMAAAQSGAADIVQSLLDAKADPSIRGKGGASALAVARQNEHAEVIKILRHALKR